MRIGDVAKAAGVSKDTVRHYVELGLLQPEKDPGNGYQMFDDHSLSRLHFIKTARNLGLHLNDVKQIFDDAQHAQSPCPRVRDMLVARLKETRTRIAELTQLHDRMAEAVRQWENMPDSVPDGLSVCRLIESYKTVDQQGNMTTAAENKGCCHSKNDTLPVEVNHD